MLNKFIKNYLRLFCVTGLSIVTFFQPAAFADIPDNWSCFNLTGDSFQMSILNNASGTYKVVKSGNISGVGLESFGIYALFSHSGYDINDLVGICSISYHPGSVVLSFAGVKHKYASYYFQASPGQLISTGPITLKANTITGVKKDIQLLLN
jgi:hypothetical protein